MNTTETVEELAAEARRQKEVLETLKRIGAPYELQRRTADAYMRLFVAWHVAKHGKPPQRVPKIRIG